MTTPRNSEPPDFDQALEQVEAIIARIEGGQIGLEQSITEYERGAALLRACRERLAAAEQRVKDLTAQMNADASRSPSRADESGGRPGDKDAPL